MDVKRATPVVGGHVHACALGPTSAVGHAALQDLLHPHRHVRHVLGYGLDALHQPDGLNPGRACHIDTETGTE